MSDVLIRDLAPEDLDLLKGAAAQSGTSLQRYLHDTLHDHVVWLRRQAAVTRREQALRDRPALSVEDRTALLDTLDTNLQQRAADRRSTTDEGVSPR